ADGSPAGPAAASSAPLATPAAAQAEPRRSRRERVYAYRLLWWIALAVFVIDQGTKTWIAAVIPFDPHGWHLERIVVIDGFFNLVHVGNTGAAWSMFEGKSPFLAVLAAVTLGGIYLWRHQLGLRSRIAQAGFGLLCGGIVGNFVDRLLRGDRLLDGHVIDFLDFHFGSYVYPTFNVADMGICIGVGIYVIHSLFQPAAKA
ncbi:MAG: signal peptidase II, partial [Opitutaceae bacterium]|nr:signal peptidase II [Opitutaceae bacterium]